MIVAPRIIALCYKQSLMCKAVPAVLMYSCACYDGCTQKQGPCCNQPSETKLLMFAGTSADMYRTVFELLVSVKLFLGRFDMRTMQVGQSSLTYTYCVAGPIIHASV